MCLFWDGVPSSIIRHTETDFTALKSVGRIDFSHSKTGFLKPRGYIIIVFINGYSISLKMINENIMKYFKVLLNK